MTGNPGGGDPPKLEQEQRQRAEALAAWAKVVERIDADALAAFDQFAGDDHTTPPGEREAAQAGIALGRNATVAVLVELGLLKVKPS
jgi:hypothetical protein